MMKVRRDMKPGEHTRVELEPEEAFGTYDEQKMMKVRRDMLPATARNGSSLCNV